MIDILVNLFETSSAGVDRDWEADFQLAQGMVEALTNNATVAFIVCDLQDKVIYVNRTFEIVFGWAKEEVLGTTLPIVCEEDWPIFQASLSKHRWQFTHDEVVRRRKNGTVFSSSETITPIKDRTGAIIFYACIVKDITARKQAERTLKESEQRFKSLFEQNPDATLSLDLKGRMTDVNPAALGMTGFAYKDLLGKPLLEMIVPEERPAFEQRFLQTKLTGAQHFDSVLYHIHGKRVDLNVKLLPIVIDKEIVGIYCIAKDVTAHNKALEMVNFMAFYDVLTELPNRRLFQERLTEALRLALSKGQRFGVVWIDLDGFKDINDTYGHAVGDYVLQEIGVKLKQLVRSEETVARMGGDEFTILVSPVTDMADITRIAERLVKGLGAALSYRGIPLKVTPSIGIAVYPEDGTDVDTLLNHADAAMYHVKETGKNGYYLYGEL